MKYYQKHITYKKLSSPEKSSVVTLPEITKVFFLIRISKRRTFLLGKLLWSRELNKMNIF